MIDKTLDKKSFVSKVNYFFKNNYKTITIILSLLLFIFIIFQIYLFYSTNKIYKNSLTFFEIQNSKNNELSKDQLMNLSDEKDFYGVLSKLELIKVSYEEKNYNNVIDLYEELLQNIKLDISYKASIASKASYELIDLNFNNLSEDYIKNIEKFISFINEDLINFKGIKLELKYLLLILEIEKNNINYNDYKKATDLYNSIMNSDLTSSSIKERVNNIHEFYIYK